MKKKKFVVSEAEHEYVTSEKKISYRKLAEKYGVNQSTISKSGKDLNWVEKRKEYQAKVTQMAINNTAQAEAHKIKILQSTTSKAIDVVTNFINKFEEAEKGGYKYSNFKECVTCLEKLSGLSFMLNGKLTPKEEATLAIAREKLQLERKKIGFDEGEEKETGIVEIPSVLPGVTENIVVEGETNA